jgi:hypothetical protein
VRQGEGDHSSDVTETKIARDRRCLPELRQARHPLKLQRQPQRDYQGVGLSLREYYAIPTELLSRLLRLVSKLDAIEGKYLSRNLDVTRDPPDEPNREEKETLLGSCRPAHVNLSEKSAS